MREWTDNKQEKAVSIGEGTRAAEIILASRNPENQPKEMDFLDKFAKESIEHDLRMVEILEQKFVENQDHLDEKDIQRIREGKMRSEAMEVAVTDFAEQFAWFGKEARLSRTSRADDVLNGVDGIVEFPGERPYRMALVVDASMRPDFSSVKRKINRNTEKIISSEKPAEVKYFKSKIDGHKGKLNLVVPVVIGIEGDNANKMLKLISEIIQLKDKAEEKEKYDQKAHEAQAHPAQVVFLWEMQEQLSMYVHLIDKEFKKRKIFGREKEVKTIYREEIVHFSGIVADIINQKNHLSEGELKNDGVHEMIRKVVDEKMR